MMTRIVRGNLNQILEMQKMLSMIFTNLTPPPHTPSPLIQQTFFCFSKSSQSHLLKSIHTAFLLITWKLIFRREVVTILFLGSTLFLVSSFRATSPFLRSLSYAYHHIFLSWDLSHSPYMSSNPYAIPCITTGQGIFFTSLFLVMDAYSSSQFSRISYMFLLLIFLSMIFHDVLLLLSRTFYLVLQYSFTYSADLFLSI